MGSTRRAAGESRRRRKQRDDRSLLATPFGKLWVDVANSKELWLQSQPRWPLNYRGKPVEVHANLERKGGSWRLISNSLDRLVLPAEVRTALVEAGTKWAKTHEAYIRRRAIKRLSRNVSTCLEPWLHINALTEIRKCIDEATALRVPELLKPAQAHLLALANRIEQAINANTTAAAA